MVPAHPLRRGLRVLLAGAALAGAALAGACGGTGGDRSTFCAAVDDLRAHDPFEDLDIAGREDMRDAFSELSAAAARIVEAAPSEARVQARRYHEAVDDLVDELAGAAYDPRRLDALRYRQATEEYTAAAVSLDNAARGACP